MLLGASRRRPPNEDDEAKTENALNSSCELMILVFSSRVILVLSVLLILQIIRSLALKHPDLGPVVFFSRRLIHLTVMILNFIGVAYLYGYYPKELANEFGALLGRVVQQILGLSCHMKSVRGDSGIHPDTAMTYS